MVLKHVGPVSCAKIMGTLYAVLGIVIGAIVSLAVIVGAVASNNARGAGFGALIGVGAIVFFPILYGGMGFVLSLIGAWLYNVVAGAVGGIEVDLQ
jgi:hypothetical protein